MILWKYGYIHGCMWFSWLHWVIRLCQCPGQRGLSQTWPTSLSELTEALPFFHHPADLPIWESDERPCLPPQEKENKEKYGCCWSPLVSIALKWRADQREEFGQDSDVPLCLCMCTCTKQVKKNPLGYDSPKYCVGESFSTRELIANYMSMKQIHLQSFVLCSQRKQILQKLSGWVFRQRRYCYFCQSPELKFLGSYCSLK